MKIRNGFVSNSSSSSFVVIMKNGEEMTKETLLDLFDVKKTSPLYSFAKDLVNWIIINIEKQSVKDIYEDYYGRRGTNKSTDEMIIEMSDKDSDYAGIDKATLEKIADGEYNYYEGRASSEGENVIETYLYEVSMNIETDKIKMYRRY